MGSLGSTPRLSQGLDIMTELSLGTDHVGVPRPKRAGHAKTPGSRGRDEESCKQRWSRQSKRSKLRWQRESSRGESPARGDTIMKASMKIVEAGLLAMEEHNRVTIHCSTATATVRQKSKDWHKAAVASATTMPTATATTTMAAAGAGENGQGSGPRD